MKKILSYIVFGLFLCFPVYAKSYQVVDSRARSVPSVYEKNLPSLVKYLTDPYKNNEEKKARAIMAWIVYHIDYDAYKSKIIDKNNSKKGKSNYKNRQSVSTGDIFETRIGVCGDIASLFQRMAGLAGLDSVVVNGRVDGGFHAWNAVKIDGKWELIDATWAIQGQNTSVFENVNSMGKHKAEMKKRYSNPNKNSRERKNRVFDNRWFMTDPKEMIKTHYPDDPQWQLLAAPKKMNSSWRRKY